MNHTRSFTMECRRPTIEGKRIFMLKASVNKDKILFQLQQLLSRQTHWSLSLTNNQLKGIRVPTGTRFWHNWPTQAPLSTVHNRTLQQNRPKQPLTVKKRTNLGPTHRPAPPTAKTLQLRFQPRRHPKIPSTFPVAVWPLVHSLRQPISLDFKQK